MATKLTKAQLINELSEKSGVQKSEVKELLELLVTVAEQQLTTGNDFVLPGLMKLSVVKKSATKERTGINPFTKKPMTISAKPDSKKVRATAVRAIKQLVK
ncbi:MAG: HU family DNA-binding protein [Ferruginibacter sp.]